MKKIITLVQIFSIIIFQSCLDYAHNINYRANIQRDNHNRDVFFIYIILTILIVGYLAKYIGNMREENEKIVSFFTNLKKRFKNKINKKN